MITEIVTFPLPPGADRQAALELYRKTARRWARNPELVRKYYVFDEATGLGGGVYIWKSLDAAARWHGEDYRQTIRKLYGAEPQIIVFQALIEVEPSSGAIVEL